MIKVLVIDDSALIRSLLKEIIEAEKDMLFVGAAPDAYAARDLVNQKAPDVITLDIEMPKMDGLTFLSKLMKARPTPVVMISTLTEKGAEATLKSLELGAVDFIPKPKIDVTKGIEEYRKTIVQKIRTAAIAKVAKKQSKKQVENITQGYSGTEKIIAIGASTGGTETIKTFLQALPADSPAIVITQHMPPGFTKSFALRLNEICKVNVREAVGGERLLPGNVYIAPGDLHLLVEKSGADYRTVLEDSARVTGHKPSVDVLFRSIANTVGKNAIALIMTGMGKDGALGMLEVKRQGGFTIAQNEESCVVFGMPAEAIKIGAADKIVHNEEMPKLVFEYLQQHTNRTRL